MNMTTQPTSIETIQLKLGQTGSWRYGMAERFPSDARNLRAAETLSRFAQEDPRDVPPDVRERIARHQGTAKLNDAISELNREVEFRRKLKSLSDYLTALADKLTTTH